MRPSLSQSSGLALWLLPWIFGACAGHPEHDVAAPAANGAHLVDVDRLPLHTQGRHIVNRLNERVKWACVNLYGADSQTFVAGGMEVVPIEQLAARIVDLGFNCIRLPFSLESFATNPHVKKEFVEANPKAYGKRFLDVFDMTITALTDAGLMIILDNHVSNAGWCCHMSQREGLWYQPDYPEEAWISTLANVTARYMHNPLVVGIGLRNEVHDWINVKLSWGDGNPETDWAMAATKAANAVLAVNPNVVIPIMALCSGMCLIPAKENPIQLDVPNRVIYEAHNYLEYVFVNIIPEDLITWHHVRMIVYLMMLFATIQLVLLFGRWKDLGKPIPSAASIANSLGYWICGLAVAGFLFVIGAFKVVSNFCYWWARNGVLPWLKYPAALLSVGLALILAAKYGKKVARRLQGEKDETRGGSDYSHISPESLCDGNSETSLEEELQQKPQEEPKKKTAIDITRMSSGELALELVESGVGVLSSMAETKKQQWKRTIHSTIGWCLALSLLAGVDQGITYIASYDFARVFLDDKWGFATEEGQPYTAPVWVGEFSYENEGPAWQHLIRYISERDMDFGFWAVNGKKYGTGFMDGHTGEYTHYSYCDNDHGCDPYEHAWDMLDGRCDQNAMEGTNCAPERSQGANGVCSYQVKTAGKTCSAYCASKGRTCVSASRLSGEGTCQTQGAGESAAGSEASCDAIATDEQVCTCSMQLWRWDNELFGLLEPDYNTVLEAWRIRDLQALAQSPSTWIPKDLACAGDYRGKKC